MPDAVPATLCAQIHLAAARRAARRARVRLARFDANFTAPATIAHRAFAEVARIFDEAREGKR